MRQEELNILTKPYTAPKQRLDRRFESSIGADIPNAGRLVVEILNDLDEHTLAFRGGHPFQLRNEY